MSVAAGRVLIVEDAHAIAQVLRRGLEREGFSTAVAHSGSEALRLLEQSSFDFVLSDYQMPDISGAELCRRIRAQGQHREVPIALCTAKAHEVDTAALVSELGLSNVFTKPFSLREIAVAIRSTVDAGMASVS